MLENDNTIRFAGKIGAYHVVMRVHEWEGKIGISLNADVLPVEAVRAFLEELDKSQVV